MGFRTRLFCAGTGGAFSLAAGAAALAVLVVVLLLPQGATALFTYPDPADTYDSPVLSSTVTTGTSQYWVSSFDHAPNGDLWVAMRDGSGQYNNLLGVYEPDAAAPYAVHETPGMWLQAIQFGPDGNLYGADLTSEGDTQTVVILDPDTLEVLERFGEPSPEDVYYLDSPSDLLVQADGDVWVLNEGDSSLVRFDATTREPTISEVPTIPLSGPRGLCQGPNDTIVVADSGNNRLVYFNSDGSLAGERDLTDTDVTRPVSVDIDAFGTTYVLDDTLISASRFIRIDSQGSVVSLHPDPLLGEIRYPSKLRVNTWGDVFVGTNPDEFGVGVQRWPFIEGNPDHTPPTTTNALSANWYRGSVDVTLAVTDSGKSGVAGTVYGLNESPVATSWPGTLTVSAEGTTTLRYRSYDNAGNWEDIQSAVIRIDSFAPMTTSDALPRYYGDATVTLTSLDANSGVAATYYSVDSGPWTLGTRVTVPGTSYGLHEIAWYSVDVAGNAEAPKSYIFAINTTYDAADPRVLYKGDWAYRADGRYQGGGYKESSQTTASAFFVFTGKNVDIFGPKGPDRGRLRIRVDEYLPVEIDAYDAVAGRGLLTSFGGLNPNTQHVLEITPLGSHSGPSTGVSIGIDAVDIAGVLEADTTPPTSVLDADTQWYSPSRLLSLTATDNTFVVSSRYSVNGSAATTYTGPFGVSYDGTATIAFRSTDAANNSEATKTVSIRCDATPPTSSSDATLTSYEDSVTVNFAANDALSGVAAIEYRLDGGAWVTANSVRVLGYGDHTVDYRAIDVAGNYEPHKSVSFLIRRPAITYDTDSEELFWNGSWTSYLDGAERTTTNSTSNYLQGYGRSTRIKVYAYTSPLMGRARVTVDGVSQLVNLYSSSTSSEPVMVYDSGRLEDRPHAFKWAWSGYYGADGYARVNFHSVEVEGVFGGTVPDLEPPTTMSNIPTGWVLPPYEVTLTQTDYLDNNGETFWGAVNEATSSVDATNTYTGPFSLSADGTNTVSYYSQDTYGNTENLVTQSLKLDSLPPVTSSNVTTDYSRTALISFNPVDTMSGVAQTRYSLDGAPAVIGTSLALNHNTEGHVGTHTVEWASIDKLGNTETTKSAQFTLLDRFEDELQLYIEQEGDDWGRIVSDSHSDGLMRYAWGPGALAGTFLGDRFDLISATRADYGIARILIDGVEVALVDQYSPMPQFQQKLFSKSGLGSGEHVFRIEWTGTKNPLSTGTDINIDALELVGPIIGDNEPPLSISSASGAWRTTPETVNLWATDNGVVAPRIYYQLSLNDDTFGPVEQYDGPFEVSQEGTTAIAYWAVDGVGNIEIAKTAYVRIDRTGPTVSSPESGVWHGAPFHLTLDAFDAGSGAQETSYTIAGTPGSSVYSAPGVYIDKEGVTTVTATAVDVLGNTGTPTAFIGRLDLTPPSSGHNAPTAWTRGPVLTTLTAEDAGSGSAAIWHVLDASEPTITSGPVVISGDGTHTLEFAAVDNVGNREATKTATVRVDNTAPSTAHNAPAGWVDGEVQVVLTATDSHSGVQSTRYSLDGGATQPYLTGVNVSGDGVHTLQYSSLDTAGNRETTKTATVRIDATKPVASDDAPTDWATGPVNITLTATDTASGIEEILYSLDGSTPTLVYTEPLSITAEGPTELRYTARDVKGNVADEVERTVRIDNTAPTVTDDAPEGWVGSPVDVTLEATDPLSGVEGIVYRIDGGEVLPYEAPIRITAEGVTTIEYRASDIVGNTSGWNPAIVRIDDTAPESTDDAPFGWVSGPVLVTLSPADAVSGVNALLYSTDGTDPSVPYTGPIVIAAQGTTTIKYAAIDTKGNVEETRVTTVSIDDDAPASSHIAPTGWMSGPVDVTLTSEDGVSGVEFTEYRIGTGDWTAYEAPIAVTAEGTTTIDYRAVDVKGNVEDVRTATVRVDKTAPVTASNALASYNGTATISFAASDPHSGIAKTEYRLDGGAWVEGTSVVVTTGGTHGIEWRSTDAVGNVEVAKSATFDVIRRFDSTDSRLYLRGTWSVVDHASLWGGSHRRGSTSGTAAHFTFQGTGFDLIAIKSTSYGFAKITIDDGEPVFVDQFSPAPPAPLWQQKLYGVSGLEDGLHRVRVEFTGSKNASSTGTSIAIDAIDVNGELVSDTTPPNSSAAAPTGWVKDFASVSLDASDTHTWVPAILYSVAGSAEQTYTAPIIVSGHGTTTVSYRSVDGAGNTEATKSVDVFVDRTAPSVTATAPSAWVNGPVTVTLDATDSGSGVETILYSTDGSEPSLVYDTGILITEEGTTTVRFRGVDAVGNESAIDSVDVRIDDTAPTVTDDAPEGWVGSPVDVTLEATDPLSGVEGIVYRIDGGEVLPYEAPIRITAEGVTTIEYRASDIVGNTSGWNPAIVRIDDTAPESTDDAPFGWVSGPVLVTLSPADAVSGVNALLYSTDGTDPSVPYTGPIVIAGQGTTTIKYAAIDTKGNVEETRVTSVSIDDDAPVTTDNAPNGWVNGPVDVTLTSEDGVSGVEFTEYRIGTGDWTAYEAPIAVTAEGTTTIQYRAVDVKGNVEDVHTATVRIDLTAPVTTSNALASYNGTATINFAASDAHSGVANTEYRLDGGEWVEGTSITVTAGGTHAVEWRSTDAVGNVEEIKSASFDVIRRIDSTDSRLYLRGAWSVVDHASLWGGSHRRAATTGTTAYFTFKGTGFDLIGVKSTSYGIARVTVDDNEPVLVDQFAPAPPAPLWQQKLYGASGLSDGVHRVRVEFTGSKNASSTGTSIAIDAIDVNGVLMADTAAPVTTSNHPAGWSRTNISVSLSATDTDTWVSSTQYRLSGGAVATYTAPVSITAEGATELTYWSIDGAGVSEVAKTATVRIDKTAPATTDNAPATWTAGPVMVALTASDTVSGVTSTEVRLNDAAPFSFANPFAVSAEGISVINYRSTDTAGNVESTRTALVRIDTTPPSVSPEGPVGWVNGAPVVTLRAQDAGSGVAAIYYSTDGSYPATEAAGGKVTISAEGTTTLRYRAVDGVGNTSLLGSTTVLVDSTAPSTTSNAVARYNESALVALSASDALSGIARTEYRVNGGTWTAGNTVSINTGGRHSLEWRSIDVAGNVEQTKSATLSIVRRLDNTDSRIWYRGAWSTVAFPDLYGGSHLRTNIASTSVNIAFKGTEIDLLAIKSNSYGIAKISVDNTAPVMVDLYAPAPLWKQKVFSVSGLADTTHTVKVEYTGSKNASSTGASISLDGLDVVGELVAFPYALHDDASSLIAYTPNWSVVSDQNLYGGAHRRTNIAESAVSITFNGTAANIFAIKSNSYGIAKISVDNTAPVIVDLYAPAPLWKQKVFSVSGLTDGQHTIRIEHTGSKNTSSTGASISLDYVEVLGDLKQAAVPEPAKTRYEEVDTRITFTSDWTSTSYSALSGGAHRRVDGPNQAANIAFTGTGIDVIAAKTPNYGIMRLILDGGTPTTVDLYAAKDYFKQRVASFSGLSDGPHTLRIEWTGTKNAASASTAISLDAVDVTGVLTQAVAAEPPKTRFEQTDTKILFNGDWATTVYAPLSAGSALKGDSHGVSADISFSGTAIDLIAARTPKYGIMSVSLDGGAPVFVDLYADKDLFKQRVFSANNLASGPHTVRIEWTGTKNPASGSTAIGLDAVDLLGTPTQAVPASPPMTRFEQDDPRITYDAIWTSALADGLSGGSHTRSSASTAAASFNFEGTAFDLIGIKSPVYGFARVTVDGGEPVEVDLYSPTVLFKQRLFGVSGLEDGVHSVRIEFTGLQNPLATGASISLDAVDILGSLTTAP